jgi:Predicted ATPases
MSSQHLTYFKVENFKRFDSLELTDIGQFNLVVGDNNVGKTSLLEALDSVNGLRSPKPVDGVAMPLSQILVRRGINATGDPKAFFTYLAKNPARPIKLLFKDSGALGKASVEISLGENIRFKPAISGKEPADVSFGLYSIEQPTSLIPASIQINNTLPSEYQKVFNYSRSNKQRIIQNLKIIDQRIVDIEVLPIVSDPHVMIGFENEDRYLPLTSMGESTIRVFNYLLKILSNTNGLLLIDEIDTGIHYSRMSDFLRTIFQMAEKNNVQLFLTTHSLECQQAFAEVFEKPDMVQHQDKVRQFTLIEKPDRRVAAINRNWAQLEFAIETDNETRGGRLAW